MRLQNAPGSPRGNGFTLVELLLAVTLLAGLIGAVSFGFASLHRNAQLDEGVERVETALRFARAHAASTGHKVQVVLAPTPPAASANAVAPTSPIPDPTSLAGTGSPDSRAASPEAASLPLRIEWEADPVHAPGIFEPIAALPGEMSDVTDLVEVRAVERESAAPRPAMAAEFPAFASVSVATLAEEPSGTGGQGDAPSDPPSDPMKPSAITFYPDGSCDGATIVLASRDAEDAREVAVRVQGVTGTTRREWRDTSSANGTSVVAPANPAPAPAPANAPQRRP